MSDSPLDFSKIEALRKHLLLSPRELATLFGVSHVTYYGWMKGKPLRKSNAVHVRKQLKTLLAIITDHEWPTPEAKARASGERFARLQKILATYN